MTFCLNAKYVGDIYKIGLKHREDKRDVVTFQVINNFINDLRIGESFFHSYLTFLILKLSKKNDF